MIIVEAIYSNLDLWLIVGFIGQSFFFLRFILQWIYSEKLGKSAIPIHFWYLSIAGAAIVFVYAIVRGDPVFFIGQIFAILIYIRNLQLIKKNGDKHTVSE